MKYTYGKNQSIDLSDKDLYDMVVQRENLNKMEEKKRVEETVKEVVTGQPQRSSNFSFIVICCVILILLAFTIWRYSMVGKAINKGQTVATVALMSPEIGYALKALFI